MHLVVRQKHTVPTRFGLDHESVGYGEDVGCHGVAPGCADEVDYFDGFRGLESLEGLVVGGCVCWGEEADSRVRLCRGGVFETRCGVGWDGLVSKGCVGGVGG